MNMPDLAPEKVHPWPRVLAGGALLASALTAVWSKLANGVDLALVWWLPVVVVAVPLCAVHRRTFRIACWTTTAVLVVLAVVGCSLALFIHLPAAFILAAAALADPRGDNYRVAVALGVTVTMAATAGWATGIYRWTLTPPDMFIVHTGSEFDVMQPTFRSIIYGDGSGIGFGADSVSFTGSDDGGGPVLHVRFRADLSPGERDRLRRHLLDLPGVTEVRLCNRLQGEC